MAALLLTSLSCAGTDPAARRQGAVGASESRRAGPGEPAHMSPQPAPRDDAVGAVSAEAPALNTGASRRTPPEESRAVDGVGSDKGGAGSAAPRDPAPGGRPSPRPSAPGPRPSSPGVKAGSADDNLQFSAFLRFLEENHGLGLRLPIHERVVVTVQDKNGLPLADAQVEVEVGGRRLLNQRTYADGRTLIFPSEQPALLSPNAMVRATYQGKSASVPLGAGRRHRLEITLDLRRTAFQQVPLDVAFILDTTGSMGDEIQRLKKTLEYINFQISHLTPAPAVRFGMVLFRDRGDEYRTRIVPFTTDVKQFQAALNKVRAGGGGDTPEDVQEALRQALLTLRWRDQGAKLAFLIGDAPPHLDYGQTFTYLRAAQEAAWRGIKITAIGASGLDRLGEVVWRQVAQYTMAPFVFLTRGETGDSEGSASSVSHHVGSNWVAENLDAIIIRMIKLELAHYSPRGTPPQEDYFEARQGSQPAAAVLEDLFGQAVAQLLDYSVQRIAARTPTMVLPIKPALPALRGRAQKLQDRLALSLARAGEFQLLESGELSAVIEAQSAQLTDSYDSDQAVKLGKLIPAKLAVLGRLSRGEGKQLELLIKLVKLETGEILSLSLLKIDRGLL